MGGASGRIFLSYRREDTRHAAGRIADRLKARLESADIFMDVDTIVPGADFTEAIAEQIGACDVLLAVIGPGWLAVDEGLGRPRLHEENDIVALEIGYALELDLHVIPTLVDDARMPAPSELPESLRELTTRNAVRVEHETFNSDVNRLIASVELYLMKVPPAIPTLRIVWRVLLWWLTYALSIFMASLFALVFTNRLGDVTFIGAIGPILLVGVMLLIGIDGLRGEITKQRDMLAIPGPEGSIPQFYGPLSTFRVRASALGCIVASVGYGLFVAFFPLSPA